MCHHSPHSRGSATVLALSLGVGTTVPDEGGSASAFIQAVDQRLYAAKQKGRNRVETVG
ncbi:diguanylate cyclase domain-containing protein [Hydrogenophaga atypica]|uniref:Diguanylate cyclase domain-containing protein n=1 Tax=Hydrogenophaga atypica TaxID=249409 RepID=A0ABW2QMP2_9BURK